LKGFVKRQRIAFSSSYEGGEDCVVLLAWNASWYVRYGTKTSTVQECRFYYNNMEKNFWAIQVHTGKMQKFTTVSSQICIMQYFQRTLSLSTLVCFCSICGPCFVGNIQKDSWSMSLLQHCFIISHKVHKTIEKAQNISSKSHRLNTLHVLRDWRHVIFIFS